MSWISTLAGKASIFFTTLIIGLAFQHPFVMKILSSEPTLFPFTQNLNATSSPTKVNSVATTSAQSLQPKHISSSSIISSSTTEVGGSSVVVNCVNKNPNSIEILKDGSTTQTLGIYAADGGVDKCPSAIIQDINFDGYPDFMVLSDTGTGGGTYAYWLYSSTTQKFSCSEPYNDCSLVQPSFYPSTKEIMSVDSLSAGTVDVQVYGVSNGRLQVLKEQQGDPTIIGTFEARAKSIGF